MKSIIQSEKQCYITDSTYDLHRHHIFFSSNRKKSERYGLWVWLRGDYHNTDTRKGVHFNRKFDLELKQTAQRAFEKEYPTLDFLKLFGRNYL